MILWEKVRQHAQVLAWLVPVFILGVALRAHHAALVPLGAHTLDWESHLEYIRYVLHHWRVPVARGGWEFYQPPLYYFFAAAFTRFGFQEQVAAILTFSFLVSVLTLILIFPLARVLFPENNVSRLLFCFLLATSPELIFFSAAINNDIFVLLADVLFLLFFMRWWRQEKERDWYLSVVCIGIAVLCKSTGLLLLPVLVISLVVKRGVRNTHVYKRIAASALLLFAMTSWIFAIRFNEGEFGLIGNASWVASAEAVQYTPSSFFIFNPVALLGDPYNHPWLNGRGKDHYWEYLFRSVFTGEADFGPVLTLITQLVYVAGLLFLLLFFCGICTEAKERFRDSAPLAIMIVTTVLASVLYCLLHPFAPLQDFRYMTVLLIPISYFCLKAGEQTNGVVRIFGEIMPPFLCVVSGGFMLVVTTYLAFH